MNAMTTLSPQYLALHYGLRLDASPEFIQGYVDGMRFDQRGQGVACGRGWIPRSKKCSRDKAKQTSKEAKAKTVEKAKARAKLKGEVRAAKGQKAYVKENPPGSTPDSTFQLSTYRKKGINAYLVKNGDPIEKAIYGKPADGEEEQSYKGKRHSVNIDLSRLEDGVYIHKQAGGADFNKPRYGWIEVKEGKVVNEGEGRYTEPSTSRPMPSLNGTLRQVSWAEDIRQKAIQKHGDKLNKYLDEKDDAKWWIENRNKLN